jgi:riboflavin synthase
MFTGIVEHVGTVANLDLDGATARVAIVAGGLASELRHGESVAVDGVCLTVAESQGDRWSADLMKVTLEHTTLGGLRVGDRVNLERAVRADGRLGGHIVQGHADGVAELVSATSHSRGPSRSMACP